MKFYILFGCLYKIKCGILKKFFCCINKPTENTNTNSQNENDFSFEEVYDGEQQNMNKNDVERLLVTQSNPENVNRLFLNPDFNKQDSDSKLNESKNSQGRFNVETIKD
ncbi:hypothetical protein GVAV_002219 [Gurleya vavrai]